MQANVPTLRYLKQDKTSSASFSPFLALGVVSMATPSTLGTAQSVSRSWWEMLPRMIPGRDRWQMNSFTPVDPVCVIINCISSY